MRLGLLRRVAEHRTVARRHLPQHFHRGSRRDPGQHSLSVPDGLEADGPQMDRVFFTDLHSIIQFLHHSDADVRSADFRITQEYFRSTVLWAGVINLDNSITLCVTLNY